MVVTAMTQICSQLFVAEQHGVNLSDYAVHHMLTLAELCERHTCKGVTTIHKRPSAKQSNTEPTSTAPIPFCTVCHTPFHLCRKIWYGMGDKGCKLCYSLLLVVTPMG